MRRHFRNYDKPEGWSKGQPEVLIAKNVIKKLGEPSVNYDALHQFITDVIGVPYDDKTFIKLYGRSQGSPVRGFHEPYTRTVHVNALAAEKYYAEKGGTMHALAHELRHRGDGTNRKVLTAVEVAARLVSFKAGLEVSHFIPVLSAVPALGAVAARGAWYKVEPAEVRARKQAEELATSLHQADIMFPYTERATVWALAGVGRNGDVDMDRLDDFKELSAQVRERGFDLVANDVIIRHLLTRPAKLFDQQRQ